jgi:phospholipid-binding lipoprotein MlaA
LLFAYKSSVIASGLLLDIRPYFFIQMLPVPTQDFKVSLLAFSKRNFYHFYKEHFMLIKSVFIVFNQTKKMQNAIRLAFYLFIFLLFFGCSQHIVKQDEYDYSGNTQAESEAETAEDPSQPTPENEFTDKQEQFDEDEEAFEEFEDEFGGDEIAEVFDPFSGYNRAMTTINDKLYFWVLKPVVNGYRWVMPEFARRGINNLFKNLYYPVRFVNNVLQLKFNNAGMETVRFVTNSTIGVLGLWDPATVLYGLKAHPEDFGQTLGYWGVGAGPHIVLPVLGPSNLRDTIALAPDWIYLDPINNIYRISEAVNPDAVTEAEKLEIIAAIWAFEKINYMSLHIGEYENLKKDALDFYTFMRDVYEQNRLKEIEE